MTFGALHSDLNTLRRRLAVHVKPALAEITIEVPRGDADELSFIRLVAWGYVMLNETARVPFGFLKSLPPWSTAAALLPHVGALRTSMSHNLAFDSTRDVKTMRTASEWYSKSCGVGSPVTDSHWKACFAALLKELSDLLALAIHACDQLIDPTDGERLVAELQLRLDRDWPGHRFDHYVDRAVEKFGYALNPVNVRGLHLAAWRKVLAAAREDQIEQVMTQRIEADVLECMCHALPAPADEVVQLLCYEDKAALAAALLVLRAAGPSEARSVLDRLRELSSAAAVQSTPVL
ncbi:UNVERIFIED_ORG: hypothetical protein HNP28_001032 [Comamonas terrigena]